MAKRFKSTYETLLSNMVEIDLLEDKHFLMITETLKRIGIKNHNHNTLYQTCYMFKDKETEKHYIAHFKELLWLDGRTVNIDDMDVSRRNGIAKCIETWGLCRIIKPSTAAFNIEPTPFAVIKKCDVDRWTLTPKYTFDYDYYK